MSNELAVENMRGRLNKYRQSMPVSVGSSNFLKFNKGDWLYGAEGIEVDPESTFIVAAASLGHGYIAFHQSKPFHEVKRKIWHALPPVEDLPSVEGLVNIDPQTKQEKPVSYDFQVGFTLAGVSGAERGKTFQFWSSSHGGVSAHTSVVDAIEAQMAFTDTEINPIVKLSTGSYPHKNKAYGRVKYPIIEIIGWTAELGSAPAPEAVETEGAGETYDGAHAAEAKAAAEDRAAAAEDRAAAEAEAEADEMEALKAKLAKLEAEAEAAKNAAPAEEEPAKPRRRRAAPKV